MNHESTKELFRRTPAYNVYRRVQAHWELYSWSLKWAKNEPSGKRPATPPRLFKQRLVSRYAEAFASVTFIETGTFLGDMVKAQGGHFDQIISIEVDEDLFDRARQRFARNSHVTILHGDSGSLLPEILDRLPSPQLFWLDAHAMGRQPPGQQPIPPIRQELRAILANGLEDYVLLIDDARLFVEGNAFPTIAEIRRMILRHHPSWHFEVRDDIIRAHPSLALRRSAG